MEYSCILDCDSPSFPPSDFERRECGCPSCMRDLRNTKMYPTENLCFITVDGRKILHQWWKEPRDLSSKPRELKGEWRPVPENPTKEPPVNET